MAADGRDDLRRLRDADRLIYTIFAWKHTLPALYVSYPISWVITAAMHVVCFVYFWKRIRRKLEQTAPAAADIRKES